MLQLENDEKTHVKAAFEMDFFLYALYIFNCSISIPIYGTFEV